MEILYSNIGNVEPTDTPQPEPEEEGVVAREARPSEGRPSILKVSARSRPSSVAGAIAGVVRETGRAEVQAIGAGATNQAVKAVAIARSYLQEDGIDIVCIPGFVEVMIEQEERTAIRLIVERRDS
jgi:stage V sporulation protein S